MLWDTEMTSGIDWLDPDMYVGDRIGSLIFLGAGGGRGLRFQNSSFKGQWFEVRVDGPLGVAAIGSLDTQDPASDTPGVTITVHDQKKSFNDILSSVEFN